MIPTRLIRAALTSWLSYRRRRELYRAYPALRQIDANIAKAEREHRATAALRAEKKRIMHQALAGRRMAS